MVQRASFTLMLLSPVFRAVWHSQSIIESSAVLIETPTSKAKRENKRRE